MTRKRGKRHSPEQIVRKLRDADAMLNGGKDQAAVLQTLEVSEATYLRWRNQYGGMKAQEAKRLKELESFDRRALTFTLIVRTVPSSSLARPLIALRHRHTPSLALVTPTTKEYWYSHL